MREIYGQIQARQQKEYKKAQRRATLIGSLEVIAATILLWGLAVVMLVL